MTKNKKISKVNLALQGGGAHGAYTWGVLDRLLEQEDLVIEGISGTSAGAMNAAILANGYTKNGPEGAKEALKSFWWEISLLGNFSPFKSSAMRNGNPDWNLDWSLSYNAFALMSHMLSPYQMNPLNMNPLKWVLEKTLDIEALRSCEAIKLFIAATAVRTGHPRIFRQHEVTIDVLLASACIPTIFQSVIIEGEPYWDGGYMGNPVIWPLIYYTDSSDIILVQINPLYREETPYHSYEIVNRLNEITFNSSLIAEMRAVHFVSKLIADGKLNRDEYKHLNIHIITEGDQLHKLNASSKMNTKWEFFQYLRSIGYARADEWLKHHKSAIGERSSIDIREVFLSKKPKFC
ncbi:patatin-like phospholipase family protein [Candidatus Paracaedibacter symbiosus]|uniref:patatin-like phospholipase family protein n=1 Tax=Candidatus Paracaedibacter symbiosus TaxID=244582 RepID=UPI0005093DB2|nr:patatin-like phospholipase family protein [Candidatus Paracaedibacter symbiosus]